MLDEAPVGHRVDGHGLLREPEKEFPPVSGRAAGEPKRELVQVRSPDAPP